MPRHHEQGLSGVEPGLTCLAVGWLVQAHRGAEGIEQ
jgi:hypothetical protein